MKEQISRVISYFSNALSGGGVAHAYLIFGGNRKLRREASIEIAALLNCRAKDAKKACGKCPECIKIISGSHPDLLIIEPEGNSIKISALREIKKILGYKKYQADFRVIIIDEVARMTKEAANSILKILEEPLSSTVFLLLAGSRRNLLPTILSRCQHIYLGFDEDTLHIENFEDIILGILTGDRLRAVELAAKLEKKDSDFIKAFLENLSLWFRDYVVWQYSTSRELLHNTEWLKDIKSIEINRRNSVMCMEKVLEARLDLENNANKSLTLENLFLDLNVLAS